MTNELKPVRCGCGGRPIIEYGEGGVCRVRCSFCLTGTVYHWNKAEAVQAWNRAMGERKTKVKNIAHVRGYPPEGECGNCGFDVVDDGEYCPGCGARLEWE